MEVGLITETGRSALPFAEEELRLEPELAPTQLRDTGELIALGRIGKHRIVIPIHVKVSPSALLL